MTAALLVLALVPAAHGPAHFEGCRTWACVRRVRKRRWARRHPWLHARNHLPHGMRGVLRDLRGCETRGIAFPANYRWHGHHDGAYQYLLGTWLRTIPYLPTARLRRIATHGPAYTASAAEQDVRTAYFYPSHRGEWECKA